MSQCLTQDFIAAGIRLFEDLEARCNVSLQDLESPAKVFHPGAQIDIDTANQLFFLFQGLHFLLHRIVKIEKRRYHVPAFFNCWAAQELISQVLLSQPATNCETNRQGDRKPC